MVGVRVEFGNSPRVECRTAPKASRGAQLPEAPGKAGDVIAAAIARLMKTIFGPAGPGLLMPATGRSVKISTQGT